MGYQVEKIAEMTRALLEWEFTKYLELVHDIIVQIIFIKIDNITMI